MTQIENRYGRKVRRVEQIRDATKNQYSPNRRFHCSESEVCRQLRVLTIKRKVYLKLGNIKRDITVEFREKLYVLEKWIPYTHTAKPILRSALHYAKDMERLKRNYDLHFTMKQMSVLNNAVKSSLKGQETIKTMGPKEKPDALTPSPLDPFNQKYKQDDWEIS